MKNLFLFAIFLFLAIPWTAQAYIDPGTGSFIIQIIVATVLGTTFYFKFFWKKIKDFFINRQSSDAREDEGPKS